jgi:hypothetical protein
MTTYQRDLLQPELGQPSLRNESYPPARAV